MIIDNERTKQDPLLRRAQELLQAQSKGYIGLDKFETQFLESVTERYYSYRRSLTDKQLIVLDRTLNKYMWFTPEKQAEMAKENSAEEIERANDAKDVNALLNSRLSYFDQRILESFASWIARGKPLSPRQKLALGKYLLKYAKQLERINTRSAEGEDVSK